MKKSTIALLIILTVAGCRKLGDDLTDTSLYGKWELRRSSGGLAGATYNYPAGNGNTMIFGLGGSFNSTTVAPTGTITSSGAYRMEFKVVNGQKQYYLYTRTNSNPETQYDLTLKKDSLFIYPTGWADAFGMLWVKQ